MMSGLMPLFVLAHFSHHFTAAIFSPLTPFIRDEFSLNYQQMGWMMSAHNIAYGASHLPAGWLTDRLGPRIMIMLGISGVALFAILTGLAPSYIIMAALLVMVGIMGGGYHPAASPLVSASVDKKYRGSALGLHQIGGTASFFLAPLIAAAIFQTLSWRGTIISMAIPAFIIGIVLFVLLGKRGYAKKATPMTADIQPEAAEASGSVRRLIPFITLGMILQVLIFGAVSYIALFAVDDLHATEETGAFLFGGLPSVDGGFAGAHYRQAPLVLGQDSSLDIKYGGIIINLLEAGGIALIAAGKGFYAVAFQFFHLCL